MNRIKVSIIITVFNRKEDLKKSIPSLLQGDFPKDEYEILIGDGGSTDSTSEYISDLIEKSKKFPQKFPKIRYFPTLKNLGEMGNSIKPLYASKGKYICYFNSDAIVSKNWLKNIYNLMESKNLDVSGALQLTDPEKGPCVGFDLGPFGEPVIPYRKREPLFISGVNNFFKKSTLLKIGGFDPIIKYGGPDLELGIRARLFGAKVLGDLSNIVDHTSRPVDAHFRSPKNRENLIYFLVSRVSYSYLKNFEWRYGINLSLRYTIYHFYESLRALRNEDVKIMKGFLRGIFWILINFGKIIINHYRVKRNVKGSKLIKKFFHPELFSIKRLTKPKPSPFSRKLY